MKPSTTTPPAALPAGSSSVYAGSQEHCSRLQGEWEGRNRLWKTGSSQQTARTCRLTRGCAVHRFDVAVWGCKLARYREAVGATSRGMGIEPRMCTCSQRASLRIPVDSVIELLNSRATAQQPHSPGRWRASGGTGKWEDQVVKAWNLEDSDILFSPVSQSPPVVFPATGQSHTETVDATHCHCLPSLSCLIIMHSRALYVPPSTSLAISLSCDQLLSHIIRLIGELPCLLSSPFLPTIARTQQFRLLSGGHDRLTQPDSINSPTRIATR